MRLLWPGSNPAGRRARVVTSTVAVCSVAVPEVYSAGSSGDGVCLRANTVLSLATAQPINRGVQASRWLIGSFGLEKRRSRPFREGPRRVARVVGSAGQCQKRTKLNQEELSRCAPYRIKAAGSFKVEAEGDSP